MRRGNVLSFPCRGSSDGRWFADSVRQNCWHFSSRLQKARKKKKKAKQRVAWMRLVCHGNSVYFTDLHLDCPTSSLYSCGSLLASLSSLILFQSETAFMLLIFALSVSKPEMLCHWQTTIWSSGATHTTLGIANALTAAPPRWARGVLADAREWQLYGPRPVLLPTLAGVSTVAAELIQSSESLNIAEGYIKIVGKYALFS